MKSLVGWWRWFKRRVTRFRRLLIARDRLVAKINAMPRNHLDMSIEEHNAFVATSDRILHGYKLLEKVGKKWGYL